MWNQHHPTYSFQDNNNTTSLPHHPTHHIPDQAKSPLIEEKKLLDAQLKRQPDGPVLWFAGPPLNKMPVEKPVHSLGYLAWKSNKI
ncbi:hypothetical protein BD560DRAFT_388364 [Blakeslea trispora]|nr:hypothetical protein BD560DRAFT_388364 [Blakeslea trispora]